VIKNRARRDLSRCALVSLAAGEYVRDANLFEHLNQGAGRCL
jgi:hypothetical protein